MLAYFPILWYNRSMKNGDKLLVEIIDLGMNGEGVAKVEGVPVFIPHAVTGDLCKIRVTGVKKDYAFGEVVKVVRPSELRVEPLCPYFADCGGCDIQHINQDAQAAFKHAQVENCLKKVGLTPAVDNVICGRPFEYRNKLQLPFGVVDGKVVLGFYKKASHDVVPMTKCILHGDWAEKLIAIVSEWANLHKVSVYDEKKGRGVLRHLVARYIDGFLTVTVVICQESLPYVGSLVSALGKTFEFSLYVNKNLRNTNVILGDSTVRLFGNDKLFKIGGIKQQISPLSFLQVNDEIRDLIYARAVAELSAADIVYDVFSGAGALSAMLASSMNSAYLPCVYGLEIVPEAVADANNLMQLNNLGKKVENRCCDATLELPKLAEEVYNKYNLKGKTPNTAILLDPPRKGCEKEVLDAILAGDSKKVVYISCNPATLARDLKHLTAKYDIVSVTPYDMFPQTRHLETLVCLTRKP